MGRLDDVRDRFERRLDEGTLDLGTVLHDARTPLTVICASAAAALREVPESAAPGLKRILESARLLESILVAGLARLRERPESRAADLGALLIAAAELPPGASLTLECELVKDDAGRPFAVRAIVTGPRELSHEVPPAARRAVLREGGCLWAEDGPHGATRFVADIPRAPDA